MTNVAIICVLQIARPDPRIVRTMEEIDKQLENRTPPETVLVLNKVPTLSYYDTQEFTPKDHYSSIAQPETMTKTGFL